MFTFSGPVKAIQRAVSMQEPTLAFELIDLLDRELSNRDERTLICEYQEKIMLARWETF